MTEEVYHNEWISLKRVVNKDKGIKGYFFSHETRCQGTIVAILPFKIVTSYGELPESIEYLVKSEVTPCWDEDKAIRSSITGGFEEDPDADVIRELEEETGYTITHDDLIPLGISFGTKSTDTRYVLYSADLTGKEQGEIKGDGSQLELEASAIWVTKEELSNCFDPFLPVMYLRLQDRYFGKKL